MITTNTASPMVVHKMISPKLNVNRPVSYAAVLGPQNIIYKQFLSQSFSNSQANVNCVFNSNSLVDTASPVIGITFTINFTGVSAGAGIPLLQMKGANISPTAPVGTTSGTRNLDAPRAYPIAQIMNNLSVQIENDTPSSNVNQYWNCIARFFNDKESQDMYQCPSMLDTTQNYSDLPDFSAVDPLNNWINNSTQRTRGGGAVSNLVINSNTSTGIADTASVTFTSYEPVYLSPFIFGADRRQQNLSKSLTGLNTLIFTMAFGSQSNYAGADSLSRIWSHNPTVVGGGSVINTVSTNINAVFVNMSYYQAPLTYPIRSGIGMHGGYSYPYSEYLLLPTLLNTPVLSNAPVTIQMNTTKISAIPSKLFIWVSRAPQTQSFVTTDTAFAINNLTITFNGKDGILSSCTQQQLYEISKQNGLVDSLNDFTGNTGSFVCCKFGDQIELGASGLAPGVSGNYDISMVVTATNINQTTALQPQLNVLIQYEGCYSVQGTQWSRSISPIDQLQVLELMASEQSFKTYDAKEMLNGGSFFSKLVNFPLFRKAALTAWANFSPGTLTAAKGICDISGNRSNFCQFTRGLPALPSHPPPPVPHGRGGDVVEDYGGDVMDGYGDGMEGYGDGMEGYGEGTILGGARCKKGYQKKCVALKKARAAKKAKGKSRSKAKPKAKSKSRKRKAAGYGGEMLSYDDLRHLM